MATRHIQVPRFYKPSIKTYVRAHVMVRNVSNRKRGTIWSKKVKIHKGYLQGWHAKMPSNERHDILRRIALKDGYGTTVKRLNFLRNISPVRNVDRAVGEDLVWLNEHFGKWR